MDKTSKASITRKEFAAFIEEELTGTDHTDGVSPFSSSYLASRLAQKLGVEFTSEPSADDDEWGTVRRTPNGLAIKGETNFPSYWNLYQRMSDGSIQIRQLHTTEVSMGWPVVATVHAGPPPSPQNDLQEQIDELEEANEEQTDFEAEQDQVALVGADLVNNLLGGPFAEAIRDILVLSHFHKSDDQDFAEAFKRLLAAR